MIALTQEKREELKVFLSASIENRCTVYTLAKQRELEALRDQISLAALTAEKRATVDVVGVIWNEWKPEVGAFLFTAPPMPEIKFPDLLDIPDGLDLSSAMAALHWYENEIKRLNGLGE